MKQEPIINLDPVVGLDGNLDLGVGQQQCKIIFDSSMIGVLHLNLKDSLQGFFKKIIFFHLFFHVKWNYFIQILYKLELYIVFTFTYESENNKIYPM